ncbi:ATPase [Ponticaulis sp.]|uniref:F0F1 ATP synthase subunit B family protein n=1 Tax=Ponticaulis sp. TaxID=2020902 RepID=UPI000B7040C3|nr:ATPase [Ponticaulis sp.]MAJ08777.1 F0F1 ATP synthase subunit B [Ponticaulis sp.]RPG17474.1 MAG: F0F1 ATP synthase subunit B [Hyphomonadaceae bacterium TMED125]|tara:strand:- start:35985 stop:36548 length:564 start_codon:yes stop_codon:yes gene_type:complete
MKMTRILSAGLIAALAAPSAFAAASDPWYLNTTHWAFLTLIIFLLLVWRLGAFKAIGSALDSRADEIQRELDSAQKLREEASAMLKEAERRQQEAADQADAIVRQAEADAKAMLVLADKDLTEMVARREAQVEARIARAEEEATRAVKRVAADAATRAAADLVRSNADKTSGADTFTAALGQVKSAL